MSAAACFRIINQENRDQNVIQLIAGDLEHDLEAYEQDCEDGYEGDDESDVLEVHDSHGVDEASGEQSGDGVWDDEYESEAEKSDNEESSELDNSAEDDDDVDKGYEGDDEAAMKIFRCSTT